MPEKLLQCYKPPTPSQERLILSSPYIVYNIKDSDKKYIGSVPKKLKNQAQKKTLAYENFAEFIAERFHTDVAFLKTLNPTSNFKTLKPGDKIKVPNVTPFVIEKIAAKKIDKKKDTQPYRMIKINTQKKLLFVIDNNTIIASFPISPGSKTLPAPKGKWQIKNIIYLPWFRYDKKMLNQGQRSAHYYNLPPGVNSPVGVVWVSLNKKGIGIHGTNESESIGRSTSHGCIRLTNWDIIKLSKLIEPGMSVVID